MATLYVLIGFLALLFGAEFLVRGSIVLAKGLGISTMVIGLTVVAMGTSAPEFVVSLQAALRGAPGIAMGNVVGSNIANILFILGAAALVRPIPSNPGETLRDGLLLVGASAVFVGLSLKGVLGFVDGLVLTALFVAFLIHSYLRSRATGEEPELEEDPGDWPLPKAAAVALAGGIALVLGARLLVDGGTELARAFGVSEAVIGLTLVAVGTSLPELAASVVASYRGHSDLALGNVVGSNLFNMLAVIGPVVLIHPLEVPAQFARFDFWVMGGATLLIVPLLLTGRSLSRVEGGVLLLAYVAYLVAVVLGGGTLY